MKSVRQYWPSAVLFAALYFIYWATPNQLFSFDAITNAIACERNEVIRWFHSNHPLYPSLGVLYFRLEQAFGYTGYAVYSLARLNALLMALGLTLLFHQTTKKMGVGAALVLVYFLAGCYSVWHYAVDGRAIGASVFFAILVILYLFQLEKARQLTLFHVRMLAVLSVLYVLAHGIAIFHVFAVGLWFWRMKTDGKRKAVHYALTVGVGLLLIHAVLYVLVASKEPDASFLRWLLGYTSFQNLENPLQSPFWSFDLSTIAKGLWTGWANAFHPASSSSWSIFSSIIIPVGYLILLIWGGVSNRKAILKTKNVVFPLVGWGIFTMVFLAIWSPGQEGFRLHVLVPWSVALHLLYYRSKRYLYGVTLAATVIFLANLKGPIAYAAYLQNNKGYMALKRVRDHVNESDLIVALGESRVPNMGVLLPYFFPELGGGTLSGRLFAFREKDLTAFGASLSRELLQGRNIYFFDDFFNASEQAQFESHHGLVEGSVRALLKRYSAWEALRFEDGTRLYRMRDK